MDVTIDGDGAHQVRLEFLCSAKKSERWMGGRGSYNQVERVVARLKWKRRSQLWWMVKYIYCALIQSIPLTVTPSGHGKSVTVTRLSL